MGSHAGAEWHSGRLQKYHSALEHRRGLPGQRGTAELGCSRLWHSVTATHDTASSHTYTLTNVTFVAHYHYFLYYY